jgi:acyl-CoA thioester hydrolase
VSEAASTTPVRLRIPVAWGDMDAFGHVNNVVYLRWFESGRIALFDRVGILHAGVPSGPGPILARTGCEFLLPLSYPDFVTVETRIATIGTKSFVMTYEVRSEGVDAVAARGDGVIVWYDYGAGRSIPVPDALRQRLDEHRDAPHDAG